MKLYIECNMGLAGDMLTGALLELFPDPDKVLEELNDMGIPGVVFRKSIAEKCGIQGANISVIYEGEEESEKMFDHHEHHDHVHLSDVKEIISSLDIAESVKEKAIGVYDLLAEAEAHVHGTSIDQIHFHEVGTMDAVADITAVSYLMEKLSPEEVIISPIHVGRGFVRCAHGILPVPAPAAAYLLKDIPIYSKEFIEGELCTPTGAALAKYFGDRFEYLPVSRILKTGYGLGKKDFPAANAVRAMLIETEENTQKIIEFDTNLDDMTGEEIAFACEEILKAGANEVFTVNVSMKKNRPGILLTVLAEKEKREEILRCIFANTTTLGVREVEKDRTFLKREIIEEESMYGTLRMKRSSGMDVEREKYEYEDLAKIAREKGWSLLETKRKIYGKK